MNGKDNIEKVNNFPNMHDAPAGEDLIVLDLFGLGKGIAWVNGNDIGRYWPSFLADKNGCNSSEEEKEINPLWKYVVKSSSNAGLKNNVGLIVGVTMVVQVAVLVVAALLFWVQKHLFNGINTSAGSNPGHPIPLTTVLEATNNYYESLVVRAGGFGYVYAGTLTDGTITIVKRANPRSRQGLAEFQNEIKMLSHPATSIRFHVMKMMR
ncbi:hypothetical protein LguiA_021772 [Lonicera macranthoides]